MTHLFGKVVESPKKYACGEPVSGDEVPISGTYYLKRLTCPKCKQAWADYFRELR